MKINIQIEVEVERISGLFAPKDEIADQILSEIEGADPGSVTGVGANGDSEYEIVSWEAMVV